MRGKISWVVGLLAGANALTATPSSAQVLTVQNPSFEQPSLAAEDAPPVAQGGATSWATVGNVMSVDKNNNPIVVQSTDGAGVFANNPGPGFIPNADGQQLAYIESVPGNEFSQMLSATFLAGHAYQITGALAASLFEPPSPGDTVSLGLFYLDSGSVRHPLTTITATFGTSALGNTFVTDYSSPAVTITGNSPAVGQPVGLLISTGGSGFGVFDIDNIRVTPEPDTLALAMCGGIVLMRGRRRR